MADNLAVTPGTGATVAADDIGGVLFQRVKLAQGADGTGVDVSSAAPLQVSLANHAANATAVKVDGSAVTQPVSIASVPSHAVTNAGTFAVQATLTGTAIKAASTAATASDPSLVVALSPNSVNANGQATFSASAPVVLAKQSYEAVAASQTTQAMGATGATGDFLSGVLVVPATTSPGAIAIKDGAGTAITVFTGGASSVSNLVPFFIPIGANSAAGAWQITTGANVSAIGVGNFT